MTKSYRKHVVCAFICLFVLTAASASYADTTYWWKVSPNTCTINTIDSDPDQAEHDTSGTLSLRSDVSGTVTVHAYCNVVLAEDATMNLLRIRTFDGSGIPNYTDVQVALKRVKWDNSSSTIATADMDPSDTYDDASFSSAVDNENYMYFLDVYLNKTASATSMPELDMIEIRYTRP